MRLPSKVTPFQDSVLALFPLLLNVIKAQDIFPMNLFDKVRNDVGDVSNFIEALDCLFALGKIKLNEQTELLSYVD